MGDHLVGMHLRVAFLLANPGVPAQGYVPLGGMGTGWVVDTQGFTPVLPYPCPLCSPVHALHHIGCPTHNHALNDLPICNDVAAVCIPSVEPLWSYKDGSLPPTCSVRVPHLVSTLHAATPCVIRLCFVLLHPPFPDCFPVHLLYLHSRSFFTTAFFLCTSIMLLSTLLHTCTIIANNSTHGFAACVCVEAMEGGTSQI